MYFNRRKAVRYSANDVNQGFGFRLIFAFEFCNNKSGAWESSTIVLVFLMCAHLIHPTGL